MFVCDVCDVSMKIDFVSVRKIYRCLDIDSNALTHLEPISKLVYRTHSHSRNHVLPNLNDS